jgi:hypothetical protein
MAVSRYGNRGIRIIDREHDCHLVAVDALWVTCFVTGEDESSGDANCLSLVMLYQASISLASMSSHSEFSGMPSRGDVRFVGSCHMIVLLGILDRCRTRVTPFLAL